MKDETLDQLIDEAHQYFDQSSIFEVIDINECSAREFLTQKYRNPDAQRVNNYLKVINKLKRML